VARSGVNPGVMSIIFSSSIIFTPVLFYCKYGQKLRLVDFIGAFLVLFCVGMIGIGGAKDNLNSKDQESNSH
jgi:drug/metabolite transporter (DMT)-like permease